jgi:hypothetical protein
MPTHEDRVKYADCMTYVRYRLEVIDRFLNRLVTTGYEIPDLETICLQFRKSFELVVMSSLCANRDKCMEVKQRFDKLWDAADIVKFVQRLNPHFYPVPIAREMSADRMSGTISHLTDEFLTQDELVEAHGRCGDLLHAENPYRAREFDPELWRQLFQRWREKTMTLLRLHTAQLVDQDTQWWVVMKFGTNIPVEVAEMKLIGMRTDE